jgi:cytochrome b pre-mRNA-processing protein 3
MLSFLFPRLTTSEPRGAALFASVVSDARRPHWYSDLGIPDTLDGRFSVLATLTALMTLRLDRGSAQAKQASVALAERFIESMDHEHRQLGYGDPTIGKIVRRLTGSLARRVGVFRPVVDAAAGWEAATASSLKGLDEGDSVRVDRAATAIWAYWDRLSACAEPQLLDGQIG